MKNNIHNYIAKTAIDYANITSEEVTDICMRQEGTLFEVDFTTEWGSATPATSISAARSSVSSPPPSPSTIHAAPMSISTSISAAAPET